MFLSKSLRAWAVKNCGVKPDASSKEVRAAITKALKSKKITPAEIEKMSREKSGGTSSISSTVKKEVAAAMAPMSKLLKTLSSQIAKGGKKTADKSDKSGKKKKKSKTSVKSTEDVAAEKAVAAALKSLGIEKTSDGNGPIALLSKAAPYLRTPGTASVKGVKDKYDTTRTKAVCPTRSGLHGKGSWHPNAGQPAMYDGRPLDHPSDLDKAVAGAYFKWSLEMHNDPRDIPRGMKMNEADRELIQYALHECAWTGLVGGECSSDGARKIDRRKLSQIEIKSLLDDSSSGGIEATPIVFDDAVVLTPVLYGELFPLVNVVTITRGRRIEGFSMGNPTFTSGTTEGAAINPFNTSAFISAFDNSIYNAVAAMEIGMDFEEDSPADIGGMVIQQYGLKAMEWLDRVIAVGDGVTEPEGVFTTVGTTAVNSDNGTGGPPTVSDYEGLMFAVTKAFRKEPGAQNCYLANEQTYRKARAIPVGPTDERRVFGMTHGDYMLLDQPYKIQIDIPNNNIAYGNFRRYRMYRRLGLNTRIETQGNYLALRNIKLIVLRMRFGGRVELGGAMGVMTDASAQ